MKDILFNIENLKFNMEVLQDKMEDLIQSDLWLVQKHFSKDSLKVQDDVITHGLSYVEQRIRFEQSNTLLQTYKKEMDELIKELDLELNKLKRGESQCEKH